MLSSPKGHPQDLGRLFVSKPNKETQFHHGSSGGISLLQVFKCLIEGKQLFVGREVRQLDSVNLDPMELPAMLQSLPASRPLDQDQAKSTESFFDQSKTPEVSTTSELTSHQRTLMRVRD